MAHDPRRSQKGGRRQGRAHAHRSGSQRQSGSQTYRPQPMPMEEDDYPYQTTYDQSYRQPGHANQYHDHYSDYVPQTHRQTQEQIQRSLQASKQMLFGVYQNVIGILEELESREIGRSLQMPRSEIYVPDQSRKKDSDVVRIAEAQLLMFETQLKNCPPTVRDEARDNLVQTTKSWMASRSDHQIPSHSRVDGYAAQLMEILKRGKTTHPVDFYHMPEMSREELQPAVEAIMHGNTKKAELDREFKDDPDKMASLAKIRSGRKASEGMGLR